MTPARRRLLTAALASAFTARGLAAPTPPHPDARWHDEAEAMRKLALSWGDQSYGAVIVRDGQVVGYGPSRVVRDRNDDAHAERVAIQDARRRLGRQGLAGAVMYSTSRPCLACERAAADAGLERMYFGRSLNDAGRPMHR